MRMGTCRHLSKPMVSALCGMMLAGCAGMSALQCGDGTCVSYQAAIPGSAGIDGGSATYNIAIEVPPGRNGMTPNISVGYSSSDGRSVLGVGWYLSVGSSVSRCPATEERDGYSEGVRYGMSSDKLCLDGTHLAVTHGQYGRSGAVYRTLSDEFAQIREYGDINDPSSYFIVTYKNGNQWYYKDAISASGIKPPLTWYATFEEDTVDNSVSFSYEHPEPGETLVSEIRYTGRRESGHDQTGTRWVRFRYEPRPDNSTWFVAGGETPETRRLKSITTGIDHVDKGVIQEQKILEYIFSYTQSVSTGRSLLTTIRECTHDEMGKRYCRQPTSVVWIDNQPVFADPVAYDVPKITDNERVDWQPDTHPAAQPTYAIAGDYDGDGRHEILFYRAGIAPHLFNVDIHNNLSEDINLDSYIQDANVQWARAIGHDIRNNGGASMLGESQAQLTVATWKGSGLGAADQTGIPFSKDMLVGDFDGSGQQDVLESIIEDGSYVVYLYRNNGSTPSRLIFGKPIEVLRLSATPTQVGGDRSHLFSVGDLDGNGAEDALVMAGDIIEKIIFFHQNTDGSLRFQVVNPSEYGISDHAQRHHIYFDDINGDGLEDIVYSDDLGHPGPTWRYQLNTGAGFASPVDTGVADARRSGSAKTSTITTDLFADGKEELIYPEKLLVDYCLPVKHTKEASGSSYECSSDGLDDDEPAFDYGIYQFAILKFSTGPDGKLSPKVIDNANIIAQANLLSAGDLQGDGITDILSPFDPGFSNGRFRSKSGVLKVCPQMYGCGLHVASSMSAGRDDRMNAAPDMMAKIDHGDGEWESWNYYPLSNPVRALYSVPRIDSPDRFIDAHEYFFTSSMYVVGEWTQHTAGTITQKFEYGGGEYNSALYGFSGFRWIVYRYPDANLKYVNWYEQSFPFFGERLGSWSEPDSSKGDDYLHGVPDDHYFKHTVYEYDCQGPPKNLDSVRWKCVDSKSPTFYVRLRSLTTTARNIATGKDDVTERKSYDYDLFGNITRSSIQDDNGVTTVTVSKYAQPDFDSWWINKLDEKRVTTRDGENTSSGSNAQDDSAAETLVSETSYEYNSQRLSTNKTELKPSVSSHKEADTYEYYEHPGDASYGNLKSIRFGSIDDDGQNRIFEERIFSYTADGYFILSEFDSEEGTTTYKYDPVNDKLLLKVSPDGKTEKHIYDAFGNE